MENNTVTRAYNFEIRADNNEKNGDFLNGRPIVYDSRTDLGWFDEIIEDVQEKLRTEHSIELTIEGKRLIKKQLPKKGVDTLEL